MEVINVGALIDLTGKKFPHYIVIERDYEYPKIKHIKGKSAYWKCLCECGNYFTALSSDLRNEKIISCGCQHKKQLSERNSLQLEGKKFGRLTVLYRNGSNRSQRSVWHCKCECGNELDVSSSNLTNGTVQSCGCLRRETAKNLNFINLIGMKFGLLTVLEDLGSDNEKQNHYWKCQCDCGNITVVSTGDLKSGHTKSCGCMRKSSYSEERIKQILEEHDINFIYNKAYFKDLILPNGGLGRYDFIILDEDEEPYRLIEFDGSQHFKENDFFKSSLEYIQKNDLVKNQYALKHHIPLVRIPYTAERRLSFELLMSDEFLITE